MNRYLAPGPILVGLIAIALTIAVSCVKIAVDQPWLGISLGLNDTGIVILSSADHGPMAGTDGAALVAVGRTGQPPLPLIAQDIIAEPDTLGDGALMRQFFDRQGEVYSALTSGTTNLVIRQNGAEETRIVAPLAHRPLGSLPWQFWTQIFVGLVGLGVGAWVVTLRQQDLGAWMLLLAGVGLACAAQSAALYSSRELALEPHILRWASWVNGIATLTFGIGMVTLFLVYPKRLVQGRLLWGPATVILVMIGVVSFLNWPDNVPMLQPFVAVVMAGLLLAIAAQVRVNRRDPVARAMIGWLGLSVALGAGGFVLTVIVPILLGFGPAVEQGTAFLFFLIIYVGVALGVSRYRLFDLADWSYGILYYVGGVALLLGCDAVLVYGLSLDKLPALSIAFAVVGLTYLPMRNRIADRLRPGSTQPTDVIFQQITRIISIADKTEQLNQIQALWEDLYRPLSIRRLPPPESTASGVSELADGGLALLVPGAADLPSLRLDYAARGGRLFSSRDLRQARMISHLLNDALTRQRAYVGAVHAERTRINRDMHDNIGILLLSALHSKETDRKNSLIRQTLTDLRDIVSNPAQGAQALTDLIADLRAEVSEVLEAADIGLDWQGGGRDDIAVPGQTALKLKSLLRESTSNIVRHSGASKVTITCTCDNGRIAATISDNGQGFDPASARMGNGLTNLRQRLAQIGDDILVQSSASGTVVSANISVDPLPARAAE